jgi:DNA repair photolyase
MPILPFIEDNEENIRDIVTLAAENRAGYILPAFGMTLRDRQRAYYYDRLDRHFPGLRQRYESAYGNRYSVPARNAGSLEKVFHDLCREHGIATRIPAFPPQKRLKHEQLQPRLL